MQPEVFMFIGRSGCGKGTQKSLLTKHLEGCGIPYLSVYLGDFFREFMKKENFVATLAKNVMDTGGLQPSFLAVGAWGHIIMNEYKKGQSLIFDGTPRTLSEAYVLDGLFPFLGFINPTVIYMNVSKGWAHDRLVGRGRADDNTKEISLRMSWFDTEVMPAVDYLREKKPFNFIEINGEQSIEKVSQDIMAKLPKVAALPKDPTACVSSYSYVSSALAPKEEAINLDDNPTQDVL